jgi:N4-(beta-N-acetylglucosaminyl)-L-asparaginase
VTAYRPSRRTVLGAAALSSVAASAYAEEAPPAVMVSTWDFGRIANAAGFETRERGGSALDMVEAGGRIAEADPTNTSVGIGGFPDRDGKVTLDACIMNWAGDIGAVCALEDIAHPVSVARAVMERTPHTMLVGEGARRFALDQDFETAAMPTPQAEAAWRRWLVTADYSPMINRENSEWRATPGGPGNHDTIGLLALGADGRMAGACTTSGLAFKMRGRVGDSPIIGAGLYVDDEVGGATATGVGEDVVRVAGSHAVVEAMRHGADPQAACRSVIERLARLRRDRIAKSQVAFLALDKRGRVGGFALQPGFTYAVTDASGATRMAAAPSLFEA